MAHFELMGWKKTEWDFVGKRRIAFAVSGLMIAIGLIAMLQIARGKARLGIDFSGGMAVQAAMGGRIDVEKVRAAFTARGLSEAIIQPAGDGSKILIRIGHQEMARVFPDAPSSATVTDSSRIGRDAEVRAILQSVNPGATVVLEGVQEVGPAVGAKLQQQAGWAVLAAVLLIMGYIWIRFEYRFGVAAAVATAHDVVAVLGIMWLLGAEFNLLIVTSLMTLAGYSLTDTVVVYDRIRETLRMRPADGLEANINRSINEVLSRTFITTFTVFLPLIALVVWGSPVTHDFSLALIIGLVIGTYSSWYVASPIIVEWEAYRRRKAVAAAAARFGGRKP